MLEPGTTLGSFQILGPLGAGGMGEVYKARDTRLDRIVAIKVLPPHLSDNPDSRERFEREARAVSRLNHPHICTLHDVGAEGSTSFLVMEFLEGETLAARLERGALPLDQALKLGIQIADALDKAHGEGIVHRDLKPGNVMLTRSGAKLLDFGLAKLTATAIVSGFSVQPTQAVPTNLTGQGAILGTLQYMAPEQLEGLDADARTDLFAFGALLYEMISGRKAFEGRSQPSLISAIMSADPPPISSVTSVSPPALDHLVRTCLAKDPADRWRSAHDVVVQLKWIVDGGGQPAAPSVPAAQPRSRERMLLALLGAAAVLLMAVAVPAFYYFRGTPEPDQVHFSFEPPETPGALPQISVSPDGRWVASVGGSRPTKLFIRALESTAIVEIQGTEGAGSPFWSPDSEYLGFFVQGRMKKIPRAGGAPQDLAPASGGMATWSDEGTILFMGSPSGLATISAAGGEVKPVSVDTGDGAVFPAFLPDGRHFLYSSRQPAPGIYLSSLDSPKAQLLIPVYSSATFVHPGYVLFVRQGELLAQPFDDRRLELSGEPVKIAENVFANTTNGRGAFAASHTGVLIYRANTEAFGMQQFVWYDRSGRQEVAGKPGEYAANFDLSGDGNQVAVSKRDPTTRLMHRWIMDLTRDGVLQSFTHDEFTSSQGSDVVWALDGSSLTYSRPSMGRATGIDIVTRLSSGLGEERDLLARPGNEFPEDLSRDGRFLVFMQTSGLAGSVADIWVKPLFGDGKPYSVVESKFSKDEPHFSFDSRWIAYNSSESGQSEVYVISFPAKEQYRQISTGGGAQPRWRRDGKELYYLTPDGQMMAVDMSTGVKLDSGTPRKLFDTGLRTETSLDQYDVTPDGARFLVLKSVSERASAPIEVILNWTRALKR